MSPPGVRSRPGAGGGGPLGDRPSPPDKVLAEDLATRLAEEMAAAWQEGRCPLAEEFLGRHPELVAYPEVAVRLIYEEMCLRQESGREVATAEVLHRFPQWRAELELLFECYHFLQAGTPAPSFPEVGEELGGFRLLAELGRGARGRVFLARQTTLADRPLVLKLTPREGQEHLALARLQHTHIVPLYLVQDFPERNLQALCMPSLGGATLQSLLRALQGRPVGQRTGQDLLRGLDEAQAAAPVPLSASGPARIVLGRSSYAEAVCWIAACLADGLQHAHERGLVHLDVKPSNVLVAADGTPMLLDFHLARGPVRAGGPAPDWLGGTPAYMSPEQQAALVAVAAGQPIPADVDHRSDIYSLGAVLYQALGGNVPVPVGALPPRLDRCNPGVSPGLAAIIHKCLAHDPRARYPDVAALAADLQRHLNNLPLRGVSDCSLIERWRKWRRRRPHMLALTTMLVVALGVLLFTALYEAVRVRAHNARRAREAEAAARSALAEGQSQLERERFSEAVRTLAKGLTLARGFPPGNDLNQELDRQFHLAQRAEEAYHLHTLAERLRFLYSAGSIPLATIRELEAQCQTAWAGRSRLLDSSGPPLDSQLEGRIRDDLFDLVILWASLRVRLAPEGRAAEAGREALRILAEAEALFGPSHVLYRERQSHAEALRLSDVAGECARRASQFEPRSAWEHYVLGRSLLRSGDVELAAREFQRSVDLRPQDFWPNYYQGICAYRLREYDQALSAFRVCIALAPECPECYYNRGLVRAAVGRFDRSLRDYDRALELNPRLADAALNRGILHYQEKRHAEAVADLRRAFANGANPGLVHYNLALVHADQKDWAAAHASLRKALQHSPGLAEAHRLQERLPREGLQRVP